MSLEVGAIERFAVVCTSALATYTVTMLCIGAFSLRRVYNGSSKRHASVQKRVQVQDDEGPQGLHY